MQLPHPLVKYRDRVEEELRSLLAEQSQPLYQMMRYQLGWVDDTGAPLETPAGKRLRPSLCLLSCEALGGDPGAALSAAAAVELVHNFSLVHDDIQDGSPQRHSRATVWWVWGPAQAINAGDGLHAMARLSLFRLSERGHPVDAVLRAVRCLDEACLRLCEGQYLDLTYEERVDVTERQYLAMAEAKTGALMGCAMQLGALLAGAGEPVVDAFAQCGLRLGVAFQIRDDILDLGDALKPGGAPSSDVLNKKKVFPIVHALETAPPKRKRELGNIYFKRILGPQDVQVVAQVLEEMKALEYAQKVAERYVQEALALVEARGVQPAALGDLRVAADFLVHRVQ